MYDTTCQPQNLPAGMAREAPKQATKTNLSKGGEHSRYMIKQFLLVLLLLLLTTEYWLLPTNY